MYTYVYVASVYGIKEGSEPSDSTARRDLERVDDTPQEEGRGEAQATEVCLQEPLVIKALQRGSKYIGGR